MSAAKPVSHSVVLLCLAGVALLGFWMGFKDSFLSAGGIKSCTPSNAVTLPGGEPIPMATPMSAPPPPAPVVKAEPKKADPAKAADATTADPGTDTHVLPDATTPKAPTIDAPPPAETPPPADKSQPPTQY